MPLIASEHCAAVRFVPFFGQSTIPKRKQIRVSFRPYCWVCGLSKKERGFIVSVESRELPLRFCKSFWTDTLCNICLAKLKSKVEGLESWVCLQYCVSPPLFGSMCSQDQLVTFSWPERFYLNPLSRICHMPPQPHHFAVNAVTLINRRQNMTGLP